MELNYIIKFLSYCFINLVLMGISSQTRASELLSPLGGNVRESNSFDTMQKSSIWLNKKCKENIEPNEQCKELRDTLLERHEHENFEQYKSLKNKEVELITSPLFWNADDLVLENFLGYLANPGDLKTITHILGNRKLPKKALGLFKKLNMVELNAGDKKLQKPFADLTSEELQDIRILLNPDFAAKVHIYQLEALLEAWDLEVLEAAQKLETPRYLKPIMQLLEAKIKHFEMKKWDEILKLPPNSQRIRRQIKHNYALLLSMVVIHDLANEVIKTALDSQEMLTTGQTAWARAQKTTKDAARNSISFNARHSARESVRLVLVNGSSKSVTDAARDAAFDAVSQDDESIATDTTVLPLKYLISLNNYEYASNIAYLAAEKATLLYSIKYFDLWFPVVYRTAMNKTHIKATNTKPIFQSDEWDHFKEMFFESSDDAMNVFIEPWLKIIDKRVAQIAID